MIHPDLPRYALSVRQPWAWCIIHAGKHLENRTQGALNHMSKSITHIAIHASTGMTRDEYEDVVDHPGLRLTDATLPRPDELIRGAIIGHVRIVDRISKSNSPWWCGPRALVLADPVAIEPIPVIGELGFFEWREPRCQERVLNRGMHNEKREPAALSEPLKWMQAWPGRYHPFANAPDGFIMPAPTPLFDALQPKLPADAKVVFPIDARTTDDERAGRTNDLGERGVTVTIGARQFAKMRLTSPDLTLNGKPISEATDDELFEALALNMNEPPLPSQIAVCGHGTWNTTIDALRRELHRRGRSEFEPKERP